MRRPDRLARGRGTLPAALLMGLLAHPLLGAGQEVGEGEEPVVVAANRLCFTCHDETEDVMEFADGLEMSIAVDKRVFLESAHGRLDCTACHVDLDPMEHMDEDRPAHAEYRLEMLERCNACHGPSADAETGSSRIIERNRHSGTGEGSPSCTDCHPAHSMAQGKAQREVVSQSCSECHEEEYSAFVASAHGASLLGERNTDVPACTDCHPGHTTEGTDRIVHEVRLGRPCMGCHADKERMEYYDVSTDVVSTYLSDFHGVSVQFYDPDKAGEIDDYALVCADCHGIHDVARMSEGGAALMKENLQGVCQRCHTEATASFPDAWLSHYEPSLTKAPLVYLVKVAYWIFIPFVIIGLSIQIFLHLVLFPIRRRLDRKRGGAAGHHGASRRVLRASARRTTGKDPESFVRFGLRPRIEHLVIMTTFVVLLVTGLPQKFHESAWAVWMIDQLGGIGLVRLVHRITGIVFAAVSVSHLVVAAWNVAVRRVPATMVPTRKDFRDVILTLRWYLGRSKHEPLSDRYDYRQKFEYWGLILGGTIMIVSGFILYFPMFFAQFLPGQFIPAAKAAHTYEAMMALLTIIIWHMYGAHGNPETFPMDTSIFTGRISRERMMREHPLEYLREVSQEDSESEPGDPDEDAENAENTEREPATTAPT